MTIYREISDINSKILYSDIIWNMLQETYLYVGGIKSNGFKDKNDMIQNIPIWKIGFQNQEIVAFTLYKYRYGKKAVAGASNKSKVGKKEFIELCVDDLKDSWKEVSGKVLLSIQKNLGDSFTDYILPSFEVKERLFNKEIIDIDGFYYKRKIGDEWMTKLSIGF